ncbi:MAG: alpha-L-rhamnosidase N-terminal domain-containing protein, partial [Salinibacter sp.]
TPATTTEKTINDALLEKRWSAQWIAHPEADGTSFGVFHFRRRLEVESRPESLVVHTSADNRYQLFVNGTQVSRGPARGEIPHWRFETTDIAPQLRPGTNVLAAVVWNFGAHRPVAQQSYETGFLLQADDESWEALNTDEDWRVSRNEAYTPIPRGEQDLPEGTYFVVGPGERVEARHYPWGWSTTDFDDSDWSAARTLRHGMPKEGPRADTSGIYEAWRLVPRAIPRMTAEPQRFARVRRTKNVEGAEGLLTGETSLTISPETTASLLFDQEVLTTAYPELIVSGGAESRIKVSYAEALYDSEGRKGNRDVVEGKEMRGYYDLFHPDGGTERTFRPLWWRTFRYVQLHVSTGPEPLRIESLRSVRTMYPFEETATFASDDERLDEIWATGWRTARVCANETYFDTPFWEQLQYVGDTRIQALISLYVDGDDRLMRKAIRAYDHSRVSEGLTESRYPSHEQQFIPPYSLFWVSMVHDYWMHRPDPAFVRSFLTPIRSVIETYAAHVDDTGLVGRVPWWNFADWAFEQGVPPGADDGHSTLISLQLARTLDQAADLASAFGRSGDAQYYRQLSTSLKDAVRDRAWDESGGLLSDTPKNAHFSQHTNVFGVLTGLFSASRQRAVMRRVLDDESLVSATYYFRFYLHRALRKAGLADRYRRLLTPWTNMLDRGLMTFAEEPDPTRSDS